MGRKTTIPFAEHSFNGWWGCQRLDDACEDCYAAAFSHRLGLDLWSPGAKRRTFGDAHWAEPLAWDRAAAAAGRIAHVFGFSMADVLDKQAPSAERDRFWALVRSTRNLFWILFTRRLLASGFGLPPDWGDGYPNVMLVVSAHDLDHARRRIPILQSTPAAWRGISMEPLRENWLPAYQAEQGLAGIDWIMIGGQARPKAGEAWPYDLDWPRSAVGLGRALGIAVFNKQLGSRPIDGGMPIKLRHPRGEDPAEWPPELRVRDRIDPTMRPGSRPPASTAAALLATGLEAAVN